MDENKSYIDIFNEMKLLDKKREELNSWNDIDEIYNLTYQILDLSCEFENCCPEDTKEIANKIFNDELLSYKYYKTLSEGFAVMDSKQDNNYLRFLYIIIKNLSVLRKKGDERLIPLLLSKFCFEPCIKHNFIFCCWALNNWYNIEPKYNLEFDYYNDIKKIDFLLICIKSWHIDKGFDSLHLGDKSILLYYLGGAPFTFYYFDEFIDNDEICLTPREYYYYSLTSKILDVEFNSISQSAINSIIDEDNISQYYKGQIHLLRGERDEAIACFEKTKAFDYSRSMLDYLVNGIENIKGPIQMTINPENMGYEVFDQYYYYHECFIAIRGYSIQSGIYNYYYGEKDQIFESIKDAEAENISNQMYADLKERSANLPKEVYEQKTKMLDDLLLAKDGMVRRATLETDEGIKRIPEKAEIQIALTIENFEIENIDFYALLIYNYYFRGIIDQQAVINLCFYVIATAKRKLKNHVFDKLFEVGLSVTAITILCPFDILTPFKQICSATPLLAILYNDYADKVDVMKESRYELFKNKLRLQELEMMNQLGKDEFNKKCRYTSIINKVYQLDNYFSSRKIE